jgi:hypothetical protein
VYLLAFLAPQTPDYQRFFVSRAVYQTALPAPDNYQYSRTNRTRALLFTDYVNCPLIISLFPILHYDYHSYPPSSGEHYIRLFMDTQHRRLLGILAWQ